MLCSFNNDHAVFPVHMLLLGRSFCFVFGCVFRWGQRLAGSERKVSLWNTSNSDLLMASPLFLSVTQDSVFMTSGKGRHITTHNMSSLAIKEKVSKLAQPIRKRSTSQNGKYRRYINL